MARPLEFLEMYFYINTGELLFQTESFDKLCMISPEGTGKKPENTVPNGSSISFLLFQENTAVRTIQQCILYGNLIHFTHCFPSYSIFKKQLDMNIKYPFALSVKDYTNFAIHCQLLILPIFYSILSDISIFTSFISCALYSSSSMALFRSSMRPVSVNIFIKFNIS